MKKDNSELNDTLRPEYNLKRLKVRRLGPGRKSFGATVVQLEPDVAAMFPNVEAVNEALRFLIRAAQEQPFSKEEQVTKNLEAYCQFV